jgi:hypothetical protein
VRTQTHYLLKANNMKTYLLAALLALPLFGFWAPEASAGYRCCGGYNDDYEPAPHRLYRVRETAVIFDQNDWDSVTEIRIKRGAVIRAQCRAGWCHILSGKFRHAYVLEHCLRPFYSHYSEYYQQDCGDCYDRPYRRYRHYRRSWYPGYDD